MHNIQHECDRPRQQGGQLTDIVEVAVGPPFWAVSAFQGAWLWKGRAQFGAAAALSNGSMQTHTHTHVKGGPYFQGLVAIQFAGDGGDVTLGHSLVTLAAAAAAAALALVDLGNAGPHRYSAATLWRFKWLKGL